MKNLILTFLILFSISIHSSATNSKSDFHIRYNQVGYLLEDQKIAVLFSDTKAPGKFIIYDKKKENKVFSGRCIPSTQDGWTRFKYFYKLDFTGLIVPGEYIIKVGDTETSSFRIGDDAYKGMQELLLDWMRQQRCGYNPFLDRICHQNDGRVYYSSISDSTFVDVSGGWHDAGDQLKYLITGSNATARMLLAYEWVSEVFEDRYNELGQPGGNGLADVLDEAKWGIDWILKLHFKEDMLVHQVADDRDHRGWKWPHKDISDYGWGENSYRAAYNANGKPQGLGQYKSKATGVSNVAGRSAAALAIASRIWEEQLGDKGHAEIFRKNAIELYKMARENEGYQQGNSYGAPYRYNESTWKDDMEWAAAELYTITKEDKYLKDAMEYGMDYGSTSWMIMDTATHYEMYPFLHVGHFSLFENVNNEMQVKLKDFYREGIDYVINKADKNIYGVGVPFIWCSNNLVAAYISQIILYERMTGDKQYRNILTDHRDWLFGRNPWGTTMFTAIPEDGDYPVDIHTSVWYLTREEVPGGLVDGPLWKTIHSKLLGLELTQPDEFALFQNDYVVYHDDIGDYSTNEPTMDGTADAIFLIAWLAAGGRQ
ncbi:glycoside hydrolase family 9 protein [Bacteroidota bacterium]